MRAKSPNKSQTELNSFVQLEAHHIQGLIVVETKRAVNHSAVGLKGQLLELLRIIDLDRHCDWAQTLRYEWRKCFNPRQRNSESELVAT